MAYIILGKMQEGGTMSLKHKLTYALTYCIWLNYENKRFTVLKSLRGAATVPVSSKYLVHENVA